MNWNEAYWLSTGTLQCLLRVVVQVMEAHESDPELLRELLFLLSNLAQSPSLQVRLEARAFSLVRCPPCGAGAVL